jgi:hypothetical protein
VMAFKALTLSAERMAIGSREALLSGIGCASAGALPLGVPPPNWRTFALEV